MDKRKQANEKCFDIAITVLFKEIYIYIYSVLREYVWIFIEMEEGNGCYAKFFRIG